MRDVRNGLRDRRLLGPGILPSQVSLVDPDIKNIVANIAGENIQVQNVGIPNLMKEAQKAACTSCELFGLNCAACNGGLISNGVQGFA